MLVTVKLNFVFLTSKTECIVAMHGYLVMIGLISQYTVLKISTIRGRGWLFTHLMHYVEQISYLLNDFTVDKHLHSEILLIIKDCSIFF